MHYHSVMELLIRSADLTLILLFKKLLVTMMLHFLLMSSEVK